MPCLLLAQLYDIKSVLWLEENAQGLKETACFPRASEEEAAMS